MNSLQGYIEKQVSEALQEDEAMRDPSSAVIAQHTDVSAHITCKDEQTVICGVDWVTQVYAALDSARKTQTQLKWHAGDGERLAKDEVVLSAHGDAATLLCGERVALNFLQLLSGIATESRAYRDLLGERPVALLDTRKTLPNLRIAQKYAVRVGGGDNHRGTLAEAFMFKENHLHALGDNIGSAVAAARKQNPKLPLIVEVETLEQLKELLATDADIALLDNFNLEQLREAVQINQRKLLLEASGEINKDNVCAVADTGVDRISVGALTKNVCASNFSMRFAQRDLS